MDEPAIRTGSAAPTKILVVDDHPIVRLGVRQMISADPTLTICGEADSAAAALQIVNTIPPDLAIVDLSLEQGHGLDLIHALRELLPNLLVLVLSIHDEELYAERALRAGARGYIMKREAIVGLVRAIHELLAGRIYVSERVAQGVLNRLGQPSAPASGGVLGRLTDRELQVFGMIGAGLTTAEIAGTLEISVKTIETYRSNIKTKLNLKDAMDLVRFAATWSERL